MRLNKQMAALAAVLLLAGCGDSDEAEINSWMEDVRKNTQVNVKPLAEPKTFIPFAYGFLSGMAVTLLLLILEQAL